MQEEKQQLQRTESESLTESQWKANLHQAEEIIKEKDQAINYLWSQVAAFKRLG